MLKFLSSKRFVVQLILIFVLFTMGAAIGLGVPVVILFERQTNTQLNALLDQTNQTTLALYADKNSQLISTATLLVERPTLNQLVLNDRDVGALAVYLEEFLKNSGMEAIIVCREHKLVAMAGSAFSSEICQTTDLQRVSLVGDSVWLLSFASLPQEEAEGTKVVIGQSMDSILEELSVQSGLDYFLLYNNDLMTSTKMDVEGLPLERIFSTIEHYQTISISSERPNQQTHKAAIVPISDNQAIKLIGLLEIESYLIVNRHLRNVILGTLVSVSLIGAFLAVLVSQKISKPLNQLATSAAALREGDLTTPLESYSDVWEIDQLTNALEDARVGLKHSLDQIKNDKAWMENLLNSIVEGLLTIDEKTRITFTSDAIERILGVNTYDILGHSVDEYFRSASGEDLFSHQIPAPKQSRRIPVVINGKETLLAVSSSQFVPPEAGNATRALVIRDVTEEERIHRLLGEFLANITHEFRTPLSALAASVEILVEQLPSLSTLEIGQLLHALNIGIIDLQSLIDNLIEASSIEAGRFKVQPQPVELQTIIAQSIETILPIASKRGLNIIQPKNKPSFLVMADQRRSVQVLINLLSNAIKHSPDSGKITISTLMMETEVMVEVCDEGVGVPPNRKAQLFNRFSTPSMESDDFTFGLGLGLSVVKAIITAQAGKVGYKDHASGGSIFWFTIPLVTGDKL